MLLVFLYAVVHWFGWTDPWFVIKGQIPVDARLGDRDPRRPDGDRIVRLYCDDLRQSAVPAGMAQPADGGQLHAVRAGVRFYDGRCVLGLDRRGSGRVLWHLGGDLYRAGSYHRGFSMYRNKRIANKSTLRSAIGVRHTKIRQKSMGFMGGSFNTREFFHGRSEAALALIRLFFVVMVFLVPVVLLAASNALASSAGTRVCRAVHIGLMAERWYFFAEANIRRTCITSRLREDPGDGSGSSRLVFLCPKTWIGFDARGGAIVFDCATLRAAFIWFRPKKRDQRKGRPDDLPSPENGEGFPRSVRQTGCSGTHDLRSLRGAPSSDAALQVRSCDAR